MLNGVAAATVGVGVAELAAATMGPSSDALIAVGSSVIDLAPGPLKEWAIQAFGTADKLFLVVTIVAVIAVIGAIVGLWERRARRGGARGRPRSSCWPSSRAVRRCCPGPAHGTPT